MSWYEHLDPGAVQEQQDERELLLQDHDNPIGPLPQEPAAGSPEAEVRAAETIRGFTPGPLTAQQGDPEPCIVLKGSRPVAFVTGLGNARLFAAAPDLLRERDALRAENEVLRQNAGHDHEETADLNAEVERLKTEIGCLEDEVELKTIAAASHREAMDKMGEQRDALADALEKALPELRVRVRHYEASGLDAIESGMAALKLSGRLP